MVGTMLLFILAAAGEQSPDAAGAPPTLTLEQAVSLAGEASEDARIAHLELDIVAHELSVARAAFFPDVTLAATYSFRPWETVRRIDGQDVVLRSQHGLGANASATLDLLNAPAIPLYRQALFEHEAAELGHQERLRQIGFAAAEAFLIALGAEAVERAAQQRVDLAHEQLDATAERHRAGLAGANDVTRAELELATAARARVDSKGEVVAARHNLEYLVNAPIGALRAPEALLTAAAQAEVVAADAAGRLDVEALRRHALALAAGAHAPWLRYLPIAFAITEWSLTNEPGLSGRSVDGYLGLGMRWHLFDGGEAWAETDEATARARIADLTASAAARRAELETRTALSLLERARAGERQSEVAVAVARRNREETQALYAQGLTTALALTDAGQSMFEAEVAHARARYAAAIALLDLWAALGFEPTAKLGEATGPKETPP